MADTWGGIARAMEEGISRNEAEEAREEMYPGHLEAARKAGAAGIVGLLSGRHKDFVESNKAQMRELGITPSHRNEAGKLTGRYSSGDWKALQDALAGGQAVTTGLGPSSDLTAEELRDPRLGPHGGSSISARAPSPREQEELLNIRQWGTQNPNMPGSMALDPTWAGGLRGAGLGAAMTLGDRKPQEAFSQGVTGYLPGRMSVAEARKARAIRNMSLRDRQEAGISEGEYSEWDRISRQFDDLLARAKDIMRSWDIKDRQRNLAGGMGGGPSTRIQPDWAALEEDMARRAMLDEFIGRDER